MDPYSTQPVSYQPMQTFSSDTKENPDAPPQFEPQGYDFQAPQFDQPNIVMTNQQYPQMNQMNQMNDIPNMQMNMNQNIQIQPNTGYMSPNQNVLYNQSSIPVNVQTQPTVVSNVNNVNIASDQPKPMVVSTAKPSDFNKPPTHTIKHIGKYKFKPNSNGHSMTTHSDWFTFIMLAVGFLLIVVSVIVCVVFLILGKTDFVTYYLAEVVCFGVGVIIVGILGSFFINICYVDMNDSTKVMTIKNNYLYTGFCLMPPVKIQYTNINYFGMLLLIFLTIIVDCVTSNIKVNKRMTYYVKVFTKSGKSYKISTYMINSYATQICENCKVYLANGLKN